MEVGVSLSFFEGCDLDDLRRQTFKPFLDFLIGQRFDPLFFSDFDLLIGVDIRLVRIAEGVLKQELCAFGIALGFEKLFRHINLNALQGIIDEVLTSRNTVSFILDYFASKRYNIYDNHGT